MIEDVGATVSHALLGLGWHWHASASARTKVRRVSPTVTVGKMTRLRGQSQSWVIEREQRRIDLEWIRRPGVRLGVGRNGARQPQRPQCGREQTLGCVAGSEPGQVDILVEGLVGEGACEGWESGLGWAPLVTPSRAVVGHRKRMAQWAHRVAQVEWRGVQRQSPGNVAPFARSAALEGHFPLHRPRPSTKCRRRRARWADGPRILARMEPLLFPFAHAAWFRVRRVEWTPRRRPAHSQRFHLHWRVSFQGRRTTLLPPTADDHPFVPQHPHVHPHPNAPMRLAAPLHRTCWTRLDKLRRQLLGHPRIMFADHRTRLVPPAVPRADVAVTKELVELFHDGHRSIFVQDDRAKTECVFGGADPHRLFEVEVCVVRVRVRG